MADDGIPDIPLTDSTEGRVLLGTLARLKALKLPGIDPDNIVLRKLPWIVDGDDVKLPCVLVTPSAEVTNWQEGTNEKDRPQFGVFVTIVLANQRNLDDRIGTQVYWRQQIRQAFQNLTSPRFTEWPTADGDGLNKVSVDSGDKFIDAAFRAQRDAQFYLLRFQISETRRP